MQDADKGPSIQAGGDVIGVNVKGDKNIIGKNMNVSQTNTEISQIISVEKKRNGTKGVMEGVLHPTLITNEMKCNYLLLQFI